MKIRISPYFISFFIAVFYRLLSLTIRVRYATDNQLVKLSVNKRSIIGCWHNELFIFPCIQHKHKWLAIVSASKDGEYLSQVLNRLGIDTVRGSSSRQGLRALLQAVRAMKSNPLLQGFVTIDGPRGPRHEAKEGILILAQKAEVPILPVRAQFSRKFVFEKAWDKFEIPLPFATCTITFAQPYKVTKEKLQGEVLKKERQKLQDKLDSLI